MRFPLNIFWVPIQSSFVLYAQGKGKETSADLNVNS